MKCLVHMASVIIFHIIPGGGPEASSSIGRSIFMIILIILHLVCMGCFVARADDDARKRNEMYSLLLFL